MKNFIIYPFFGLANRLATIASAIKICKTLRRPLKICWVPDKYNCNAEFLELFEQVPFDLITHEETLKYKIFDFDTNNYKDIEPSIIQEFPEEEFCFKFCHWFFLKKMENDFINEMKYFKPIPSIQAKIDQYLNKYDFDNIVGVHIRKTDKCTSILIAFT